MNTMVYALTPNSTPDCTVHSVILTSAPVDVSSVVAFNEVCLQTSAQHFPHPYWTRPLSVRVWGHDLRTYIIDIVEYQLDCALNYLINTPV